MNQEFSWTAPEFEYRHKGVHWYWASIVIALFLFVVALWQHNFLFAVFVICSELLLIKYGNELPRTVRYRITGEGVHVGARFSSYEELRGFSLDEQRGELSELFLHTRNRMRPLMRVLVNTYEVAHVRTALEPHLTEVVHEDSFLDAIEKLLGF